MTLYKRIIGKFISVASVILMGSLMANAQEVQYESTHLSTEELADILKRGDIIGLEKIIIKINKGSNDRMLEVELLNYDGLLIYHVEILRISGEVVTYWFDAKTGKDVSNILE